jgi:predicted nucleic acid-binding protein
MTLYLDTSSLVKLYVEETDSERIAALAARADTVVTSAVAYAESRAAFARRRRERTLRPASLAAIVARLDADWQQIVTVDVTDALARRAGDLADRFSLRGFDAIHLASFEMVLERASDEDEVMFSTADDRLARAARRLS